MIASEFDNRGGDAVVGLSGVQDEREAIAQLRKDLSSAGAGGKAGHIGASSGERDTEFRDEIRDDLAVRPAKSDAASIGRYFEGQPVRSIDNDGEWPRPTGFSQAEEIVGKITRENCGIDQRIDEDGQGAALGASFHAKNFFDG